MTNYETNVPDKAQSSNARIKTLLGTVGSAILLVAAFLPFGYDGYSRSKTLFSGEMAFFAFSLIVVAIVSALFSITGRFKLLLVLACTALVLVLLVFIEMAPAYGSGVAFTGAGLMFGASLLKRSSTRRTATRLD